MHMKSEESPNFMKFGKVTKKLQNKIYQVRGEFCRPLPLLTLH